jgi:hypothetical protein
MTRRMDEQVGRQPPSAVTEALDASLRDLEAGRVRDAGAVQVEAQRMIEAFEKSRPVAEGKKRSRRA